MVDFLVGGHLVDEIGGDGGISPFHVPAPCVGVLDLPSELLADFLDYGVLGV